MAIERRDPVPPGRYSVFVLTKEEPLWHAWLAEHRGAVRALMSVPKNGGDWSNGTATLFEVDSPVKWVGLGLPDIITASPQEWLRDERGQNTCYWVWTEAGPTVVCDESGPARISIVSTLAPWAIAAFLGYVFVSRRSPAPAPRALPRARS